MSQGRKLATPDILPFALAGSAILTLVSGKTGTRFTYKLTRVEHPTDGQDRWFIGVLSGPDNTTDYVFLGSVIGAGGQYFQRGFRSVIQPAAPSCKAFTWFWGSLRAGTLHDVEVWHEGRCGRCGRVLTVPESIDRGIGPDCAGIMGLLSAAA